jgi:hypothetical protein
MFAPRAFEEITDQEWRDFYEMNTTGASVRVDGGVLRSIA